MENDFDKQHAELMAIIERGVIGLDNNNKSKKNQSCKHCGGPLRKFKTKPDWESREYHKKFNNIN